ncbi:uncharacterized protein E0L32_007906 [Thyridium curvatum]|uniref:Uncharacterized protein n=1 Tax=Thyridium curvatum TaxID=1093900 RepID=A0A507AVH7_9PEZI|nr:uncharacterized protein E0L32_007906 [Thyridium curvatum]TPX11487.1 hypothetical protein E0L32_007906 [Thyridium curvatum]
MFRDRDKLVSPPRRLRQHLAQHGHSPAPPVVDDDDPAGPQHAQDVPRVQPRVLDLRVVRVYAPQHEPVAQLVQQRPHPGAEEPGPGPEVLVRRRLPPAGVPVGIRQRLVHAQDLVLELAEPERPRRLVVHAVVAQLVAPRDHVPQRLPPRRARDLAPDDEEGRARAVLAQHLEDLARVLRGRVVDRQGHRPLRRGQAHLPEDVGPAPREVRDEQPRRLVDGVEGQEDEQGERGEGREGGHPAPAGAPAELGGQAEQGREGEHHAGVWDLGVALACTSLFRFLLGAGGAPFGLAFQGSCVGAHGCFVEMEVNGGDVAREDWSVR